ncbi:MAG: hypothetical protein KAJ19_02835 [Gammaproteobacteria bacterium]|nr:hypothetical protein [Gammaproteobacteria bacterium]
MVLVVGVMLLFVGVSLAAENSVEHFKMLSTVEYSGQGQFTNQIETLFTVEKKPFLDGAFAEYLVSTKDFDLVSRGQSSSRALSFTINRSTSKMSKANKELELHQQVNNQCVSFLEKSTKDNVGKTWKQTFDLSLPSESLPRKLKFTISAIGVKTDVYGDMIAIRAMSDIFKTLADKADGSKGEIKSRMNAVYLFDADVEKVYLSMSVLEAVARISGSKETLRHEVATYKTDASGQSADLTGLDKKFENLVNKIGFAKKGLEVVDESPLPLWAQSFAVGSAQVASISAAIACEGATNPVAVISLPVSRTFAMQSFGSAGPLGALASSGAVPISGTIGASVTGMESTSVILPTIFGLTPGTAAAVGGGIGAAASAGGGGGGGGGSGGGRVTPAVPSPPGPPSR